MKMWHYLKITEGWHYRYILQIGVLQITQIQPVNLYQWWIVANNNVNNNVANNDVLNQFCFVTQNRWCYDKITKSLLPSYFQQIGVLQGEKV